MGATLVMFTEKGERREFKVKSSGGPDKATIGRNKECDIQIALGVVSRRHCEVTLKGDKLAVRDLGSSNGTYVNNKRVQEAEIAAGETLTIGPVIFTLVINGQPQEVKPIRTIIGGKKKKIAAGASPKKPEDSGSIDLGDSANLEIAADSDPEASSIAALEELSKKNTEAS